MIRAGVNPLGCAIHASRKPGVAVNGHPSNACVRPLGARGKNFVFFTPRRMISRSRIVDSATLLNDLRETRRA